MVALWHIRYGFVVASEEDENQWTSYSHTGVVRYGAFRADYMGITVSLPIEEVMLVHL